MAKQYDLIVLGTGLAAWEPIMRCKAAGWSVAVVNDGPFGSTCAVRGCIPKKILAGTAEILDINRRLAEMGIVKERPAGNWQELIKFKRTVTDPVSAAVEKELRDAGIDVYGGSPRFVDRQRIEVDSQLIEGRKVHIAVGAKPARLPIEGFENLIISDDFLQLDDMPTSVVFVGGGYISFEFAHVAARFGSTVTILHNEDRPLPGFDWDIIQTLIEASRAVGIDVGLNRQVTKVQKLDRGFRVTVADGKAVDAELVVHGAGRVPAIDELSLDAAGVQYDRKSGVLVDDHFRSISNPDVFAAGDAAAAGPPLSPVAGRQGPIVADILLGKDGRQPGYLSTPSVVFTTPSIAKVGYLEQEARDHGIDVDVIVNDLSGWLDNQRFGLKFAKSKVLVEKGTHKIVGAHLISYRAEDHINIFSLAIEYGLTTEQLKGPIFAYPTGSDSLRSMF
jgi:glutathione reductase (NADPH)